MIFLAFALLNLSPSSSSGLIVSREGRLRKVGAIFWLSQRKVSPSLLCKRRCPGVFGVTQRLSEQKGKSVVMVEDTIDMGWETRFMVEGLELGHAPRVVGLVEDLVDMS